ncbi:hypothetical protein SAMN05661093_02404 [Kibdelosporangium aridum]|uniref:Uncharacterized protein n=1 Tax=Kibdelosporangium aridum TaxID=2030 RepID=A0A1W2CSE2_KIBAR|nr:hypothetical protein SAMN05661093_02404 [Kibdelosporangium aridum]
MQILDTVAHVLTCLNLLLTMATTTQSLVWQRRREDGRSRRINRR